MSIIRFEQHERFQLAKMLVLDDVPDPTSRVHEFRSGKRVAIVESHDVAQKLQSSTCQYLSEFFVELQLPVADHHRAIDSVALEFGPQLLDNRLGNKIRLNLSFDLGRWASPWSIVELAEAIGQKAASRKDFLEEPVQVRYVSLEQRAMAVWSLRAKLDDLSRVAEEVIADTLHKGEQLIDATLEELGQRSAGDVLLTDDLPLP
jgi:hypothetical protein